MLICFWNFPDVNLIDIPHVTWQTGYPKYGENMCGSINKEGKHVEYSCSEKAQFFCEIKA